MGYEKLQLVDNETVINKRILDHIQNGISALDETIKVVLTAEKLKYIIDNAEQKDVGSYYMYLGETTDEYKKGAIYRIDEV